MNGGGTGGKQQPSSFKIVNMLDTENLVSAVLTSQRGEEVLMNFLRNNPDAVKNAIS